MTMPRLHRERFMRLALEEARSAADAGDIPVGAVVVCDGRVIARGRNRREADHDPTAHAEVLALREAGRVLGRWNLDGCDLYVTLEPCPMCAYGIVLARIRTLVFGATDPKAGGVRSRYAICEDPRFNHRVEVIGGILEKESRAVLQEFFRNLRAARKESDGTSEPI